MHVLITGGAGFLGRRLAEALLSKPERTISRLTLVDMAIPNINDPRVRGLQLDLTEADAVGDLFPADVDLTYHLAAVVSAAAEADFDLGVRVNIEGTRNVLETLRQKAPGRRVVFTSSLAVYGGVMPEVVTDLTALTPQSSYGAQKAVGELLVNDYSRKGFVDGITLRLPTVCVRSGKPNSAASSFVSDVIREPLAGRTVVCPVDLELALWLTSPDAAVQNLVHAGMVSTVELNYRSVNVPGVTVTVRQMLETLERLAGEKVRNHVALKRDRTIESIVGTWPNRFDVTGASELGFTVDSSFEQIVRSYIDEESKRFDSTS